MPVILRFLKMAIKAAPKLVRSGSKLVKPMLGKGGKIVKIIAPVAGAVAFDQAFNIASRSTFRTGGYDRAEVSALYAWYDWLRVNGVSDPATAYAGAVTNHVIDYVGNINEINEDEEPVVPPVVPHRPRPEMVTLEIGDEIEPISEFERAIRDTINSLMPVIARLRHYQDSISFKSQTRSDVRQYDGAGRLSGYPDVRSRNARLADVVRFGVLVAQLTTLLDCVCRSIDNDLMPQCDLTSATRALVCMSVDASGFSKDYLDEAVMQRKMREFMVDDGQRIPIATRIADLFSVTRTLSKTYQEFLPMIF